MKKLSDKQKKLALYISQGLSDMDAYIKAGYSKDSAYANASKTIKKLLDNMEFRDLATKDKDTIRNKHILKPSDILEYWSRIVIDEKKDDIIRLKASEYIAKVNGMFINKLEVTNINYSDILNQARKRIDNNTTINITPSDNE